MFALSDVFDILITGTPLQKTTQYRYNSFGQRSELIKPDGTILYSTYDAHGRLERHNSSDSRLSYLYSYNKLGEVLEVLDEVSGLITQREVDTFGKILQERQASGATVSYTYDALDRKSALTLSDNSSIFWEYNANYLKKLGRKNSTGKELYAHRYEYDLQGRWNKGRLLNGIEVQREFDLCGRVMELKTPQFSQRVPEGGYDAVGNQQKLTTVDTFGSLNQEFDYDDRNRLISEGGDKSHSYTYDSIDNRTAKDGDPYSVNSLNQIQGFSDERFEYDANGNLIKRLGKEGTWLSSAANFAVDLAIGTTLDLSASITKEHYKNRELEATSTTQNLLQRDVKAWNDLSRKEACFLVGGSLLELVPLSFVLTKTTQFGLKLVPRIFKCESQINQIFIKKTSIGLLAQVWGFLTPLG